MHADRPRQQVNCALDVEIMKKTPPWQYDEFQHFGVDFADQAEVEAYDSRQGTTIEGEAQLVSRLGILPEHTVLEFGSGTGCFAIAAAQRCARVHAVDISEAMLAYTTARAAGLGLTNLETHHAGFLTYEHADAPVDWIVTKFALHHLPDAWKCVALAKMYNFLAPGGRLFLEDVVFSFPPSQHAVYAQHWIESKAGGFSKEQFESHVRDEYSTFGFIMEVILQHTGFVIHEAKYQDPMYAEYLCVKAGPRIRFPGR